LHKLTEICKTYRWGIDHPHPDDGRSHASGGPTYDCIHTYTYTNIKLTHIHLHSLHSGAIGLHCLQDQSRQGISTLSLTYTHFTHPPHLTKNTNSLNIPSKIIQTCLNDSPAQCLSNEPSFIIFDGQEVRFWGSTGLSATPLYGTFHARDCIIVCNSV